MSLQSITAPEIQSNSFLERRAGYFLAVPLVLMSLTIMRFIQVRAHPEEKPLEMKVLLQVESETMLVPETEPVVEDIPDPVPAPPELAATRPGSDEQGEEVVDPVEGDKVPPSEAQDVVSIGDGLDGPTTIKDWVPTTQQLTELRSLKGKVGEDTHRLEMAKHEFRKFIIQQEVQSAAKDYKVSSDGGTQGAIRMLDLEGFPEHVVREVLGRYDIQFDHRYTKPTAGRNFLNAAVTADGNYTNQQAEGFFDVLVLSRKALSMMASKELEAMTSRGFDPKRSRVNKIVFGIVLGSSGSYDLAVTDFQAEKIR